jgi:hypothetical protein
MTIDIRLGEENSDRLGPIAERIVDRLLFTEAPKASSPKENEILRDGGLSAGRDTKSPAGVRSFQQTNACNDRISSGHRAADFDDPTIRATVGSLF